MNEVQQVNILPHERYDNALMVLDQMIVMKEQMSHSTCLKTKHCAWPRYHEDENKHFETGMYRNVKIEKDKDFRMYETRMSRISDEVEIQTDSLEQVKDNLRILESRLEEDLRHDVFPEKTVELIERIRFVTDLQTVAKEISSKGGILVGSLRAQEFLLNIREITDTLSNIDDNEINDNYKRFLMKLETYQKDKDIASLTTLKIIQDFLSSGLRLFEGVEITMQGLLCAAVKISVECVVESLVSRYEQHFHKTRQLTEENALEQMEIAENGPSIFRADPILETAMNSYWRASTSKGKWHFLRTSSTIMNYVRNNSRENSFNLLKKNF